MSRLLIVLFCCFSASLFAKPLTTEQVPDSLKPWIAWVTTDTPQQNCPFLFNDYQQKSCQFPSQVTLKLNDKGGSFISQWRLAEDGWVALLGDNQHWPQQVQVNGQSALVMDKDGIPSVRLTAGTYTLTGQFFWDSLPESVRLPENTGLIALQINDKTAPVSLHDGQLWLKENQQISPINKDQQNAVSLRVFRKITDEVPLQVTTRLVLEVSGQARELKIDALLLPDLIPLALESPLPARLDANGQLAMQVKAGQWQIELVARSSKELVQLSLSKTISVVDDKTAPVAHELWVFDARPALRRVDIVGLPSIDASQTELPNEWKNLPAYSINAGQTLNFKVIRRGDPEPEPNQLQLQRKLWLDFDGGAYTVNDAITGKMTKDWRLNVLPETKLGKAALDDNNQLITLENATQKQGVEVRKGLINLNADSRIIGDASNISAVGWQQTFHNVSAELNLPPGWRLLAASGVDNVPESWLSQWTLLDLFLVLITALAIGRLWNYYWAALALVTLTLSWHETAAPHFIWLHVLAAVALLRVLPASQFTKFVLWYRHGCCLILLFMIVPFMLSQVRLGLYPHLEKPWQSPSAQQSLAGGRVAAGIVSTAPPTPMRVYEKSKAMMKSLAADSSYVNTKRDDSTSNYVERFDPNAKVQTGPGLPQWQWHKVYLSWNGVVTETQQVQLWYLSPTVAMLLNFLRVLLISLLALLLFGVVETFKPKFKLPPFALVLLLLPTLLLSPPKVFADYPSQTLLNQLQARLQEKPLPNCLPSCAQIQQMQLSITEQLLSISLDIHAQEAVSLPLPVDAEQWFPNQVLDNNQVATGVYRVENNLWLALSAGEHKIVLRGTTPALSQFNLPLPLKPKRVSLEKSGWDIVGVHEDGLSDESLQFNRITAQVSNNEKTVLVATALPPLMRVERTLQLGLNWRVHTHLTRLSPNDSAVVLHIPLLTGEAVTTEGIRVKDKVVEINLPAQQSEVAWQSTLEKTENLELIAPLTEQWLEVWRTDVSPLWSMQATGVPMIQADFSETHLLQEWHPWAGEKLNLHLTRPVASQGNTLTIDNSSLHLVQGQRSRELTLTASLRSSQGMQHSITLPENALLQSVTINGQNQALRMTGRQLTLPLSPNAQTLVVIWQEAVPISSILNTSKVDLGQDSINHSLSVSLGQDRWLLFAKGSSFGPVILFWSVLLVIFIVSLGLGKVTLTPLKTWHWFLLLIGLSQVSLEAGGIVIAWLLLLGWREQQSLNHRYFNFIQVALIILSLSALSILFSAVAQGLLSSPDMHIIGNQSTATLLNWYSDRSGTQLPSATIISLPIIAYRLLMLAWSLWLAMYLLDWLKWGWHCFASQGLWRKEKIDEQISKEL
ncbi:MAG: hypothetical protein WAX77_00240 [Methylococcaceae bacterium]